MLLQLFSDLHLERYPDFVPSVSAEADVVVLAGDIGSYQKGSLLLEEDFGLGRFSPLKRRAPDQKVFFVPGNHEFDSLEYDVAYARMKQVCDDLGISWLDREVVLFSGIRFIGTTLWSDFDALGKAQASGQREQSEREKAFRAANFYLRKNTMLRDGEPVLAEGIRELALECQSWLRGALSEPFDGKTVVVTHFAPSLRSADPRYGLTPGTAGFCNSLDELITKADLWMHGHLHCFNDYKVTDTNAGVSPHTCRVVANPLGYVHKGEQQAFCEDLIISV